MSLPLYLSTLVYCAQGCCSLAFLGLAAVSCFPGPRGLGDFAALGSPLPVRRERSTAVPQSSLFSFGVSWRFPFLEPVEGECWFWGLNPNKPTPPKKPFLSCMSGRSWIHMTQVMWLKSVGKAQRSMHPQTGRERDRIPCVLPLPRFLLPRARVFYQVAWLKRDPIGL